MTEKLIETEVSEQELMILNLSDLEAETPAEVTEKPATYLTLSHTDCC